MVTGTPASTENTPLRRTENRRSNKPIMEKRRRARINNCLNELKSLILDALKKDPARHSKLEKADILEMTVKHVESLQRHQAALSAAADPAILNKFKAGWSECVTEVGRFPGIEAAVKRRLLDHLSTCLDDRRTPSPPQQQQQLSPQAYQLSPTVVATTGTGTVTAIITTTASPAMSSSSSSSSSSSPSPPPGPSPPLLTIGSPTTTIPISLTPPPQPVAQQTATTTVTATAAITPLTAVHQQHIHQHQTQPQNPPPPPPSHHHHHHHHLHPQQHLHHQPAATAAQIIHRRDTGGVLALVPTRLSNGDIALVLPSPPPLVPAASQQPLCLAISKQEIEKPWRPW